MASLIICCSTRNRRLIAFFHCKTRTVKSDELKGLAAAAEPVWKRRADLLGGQRRRQAGSGSRRVIPWPGRGSRADPVRFAREERPGPREGRPTHRRSGAFECLLA